MESVIISSNDTLTSLWNIVKERFPRQTVWLQKNNIISIKMQYIDEFCNIFSGWFHKKIWKEEVKEILDESFALTSEEKAGILRMLPEYLKEYDAELTAILKEKVLIMLKSFRTLNMEGFTNFCIQDYRKKLEEIIDQCLDEYLSEKDYYEFLNLLQYFVEVEEHQFGELIVVADENGNYSYYDEMFCNITTDCIQEYMSEFEEDNPTANDCLITVLILMLPKRITVCGIENISNKKFLNTLQNIFGSRIEFRLGMDSIVKN